VIGIKKQRGFTLLEVVAVVIVLAIVASIAVASIGKMLEDNKRKSYVATGIQIVEAAEFAYQMGDSEAYSSDNGSYRMYRVSDLIDHGYLELPENDPWGDVYSLSNTIAYMFHNYNGKRQFLILVYSVSETGSAVRYFWNWGDALTIESTNIYTY